MDSDGRHRWAGCIHCTALRRRRRGLTSPPSRPFTSSLSGSQHARKSTRQAQCGAPACRWRNRDGIAQFTKFVKGTPSPCKQRALSQDFRVRAAVSKSIVENFPYDPYLVVRDGPDSLLAAKPRAPALKTTLGLAAFCGNGCPGRLA
jgi:hypothetical protein